MAAKLAAEGTQAMNTKVADFWKEQVGLRIKPEFLPELLATAADIAIILDDIGTINHIFVNPLNPSIGQIDHWRARNIRHFLADESTQKINATLSAIRQNGTPESLSVEVNHTDNAAWEFPVRYSFHQTGYENSILMLGRDMRPIAELQQRLVKAQVALERNYETHRDYITRYRVVLEISRDPLVFLDAKTTRVIDLNAAAARLFAASIDDLVGTPLHRAFLDTARTSMLDALLARASGTSGEPLSFRTKATGRQVTLHPVLFRAAGERTFVCRLEVTPRMTPGAAPATGQQERLFAELMRDGADGLVITDRRGEILFANERFLSLADLGDERDAAGRMIGDFLSRGGVDFKVLSEGAETNGTLRLYTTQLRSAFGATLPIEVSATWLDRAGDGAVGLVIRDAPRIDILRAEEPDARPPNEPTQGQDVSELVGTTPLKDIIAATSDVVEKLCIETAIQMTSNNRAAAAEMLGLSRQSLYVKLRKHGMLRRED
jgi:transcriptional regulator PpsR